MAKKIKCRVILHGSCREIHGWVYDSKVEAKKSVIYWNRPYTIVPITTQQKIINKPLNNTQNEK